MAVTIMPHGMSIKGTRLLIGSLLAGKDVTPDALIEAVRRGLAASPAVQCVLDAGLTIDEFANVTGMSVRTIHRRTKEGGVLDVAESDRVVRIAQILGEADTYIGDHDRALGWMREPNWSLGERRPLDVLCAEPGVALVRQSLVQIAFGGVA